MNRSQNWIVVAVAVIAAALVIAVMAWPDAKPKPTEDENRGVVVEAAEPTVARSLEALRTRAHAVDAGEMPGASTSGQGAVIATFGWGGGQNQLGRKREDQANPEGPMSLAVDGKGNLVVLDQVNGRIVKLDKTGKVTGTMPLPVQGAQDVAIAKDGTMLVMDRSLDKSVALIGADGKPIGDLPVEGKNMPEGGAATGVFTDGKDVYVEREHGDQVRLGTTDGKSDLEQPEVPGRLTRDGTAYLTAGISAPGEDRIYVGALEKSSKQQRFQREYRLGAPALALNLLDTDHSGIIYVGAVTEQAVPGQAEDAPKKVQVLLLCLDPLDGRPLGRAELPANTNADETFRELIVADEGGVYYLYRTDEKAQIQKYDCR